MPPEMGNLSMGHVSRTSLIVLIGPGNIKVCSPISIDKTNQIIKNNKKKMEFTIVSTLKRLNM